MCDPRKNRIIVSVHYKGHCMRCIEKNHKRTMTKLDETLESKMRSLRNPYRRHRWKPGNHHIRNNKTFAVQRAEWLFECHARSVKHFVTRHNALVKRMRVSCEVDFDKTSIWVKGLSEHVYKAMFDESGEEKERAKAAIKLHWLSIPSYAHVMEHGLLSQRTLRRARLKAVTREQWRVMVDRLRFVDTPPVPIFPN
jgi:hypothetical protein